MLLKISQGDVISSADLPPEGRALPWETEAAKAFRGESSRKPGCRSLDSDSLGFDSGF
jgi:hypothetical protein